MAQLGDSVGNRSQPAGRICAGNCQHFEARYESGRKIAGRGVCEKEACGAAVRVGMRCRWDAPAPTVGAAPPALVARLQPV